MTGDRNERGRMPGKAGSTPELQRFEARPYWITVFLGCTAHLDEVVFQIFTNAWPLKIGVVLDCQHVVQNLAPKIADHQSGANLDNNVNAFGTWQYVWVPQW